MAKRPDSRRRARPLALVAAAALLPRLAVLLHERGDVTAAYVDKGDDFARTFLASGTYRFGLAVLGNVRLALVPVLLAAYLLVLRGRPALVPALVCVAATAVVVAPWVVRNRVSVGCAALTTDGRALWKANNPNTLHVLEHG